MNTKFVLASAVLLLLADCNAMNNKSLQETSKLDKDKLLYVIEKPIENNQRICEAYFCDSDQQWLKTVQQADTGKVVSAGIYKAINEKNNIFVKDMFEDATLSEYLDAIELFLDRKE